MARTLPSITLWFFKLEIKTKGEKRTRKAINRAQGLY